MMPRGESKRLAFDADLVDEVAHLVWKEGHYSIPWEEWKNKERWRHVARAILEIAFQGEEK